MSNAGLSAAPSDGPAGGAAPCFWENVARRHLLTRRFRRLGRLMVLVVGLGLLWRIVRYAVGFPLWGDEGFVAMNFLLRGFAEMLRAPLEYGQICPLPFMWGELAAVRAMGPSEWSMRLLPFLAGLACLVVFWRFVGRVVDRRSALLATAILACAYYPVRHAAEVKPYAVDLLASLVLTWLAWSVSQRPRSIGRWAALSAVAAAGVWISFPAAFVASGVGAYLAWSILRSRRFSGLVPLAFYALAAGGSFCAMYVIYARPQAAANPYFWTIPTWKEAFPPLDRPWMLPWWFLKIHTGLMLAYPFGGKNFGSTATFLLVLTGCVSLWRKRRRDVLLLLLAPLAMSLIAAAMRRYPYGTSARITLHLAPAFIILMAVGLSALLRACLRRRLVPEGVRVVTLLFAAVTVVNIVLNVLLPYKVVSNKYNRAAVRDLAAMASPGDQWVVVNSPVRKSDYAPILVGTNQVPFRFYVTIYAPVPVQWSPRPECIEPATGRTWMLYFTCPPDPDNEARTAKFEAYLKTVTERLGQPKRRTYSLHEPDVHYAGSAIEVYEFAPRAK